MTSNVAQRRRLHQQLRQIGKELEIAKIWILMLEERRLAARRLENIQKEGGGKSSSGSSDVSPSSSSVPQMPDWLSALR